VLPELGAVRVLVTAVTTGCVGLGTGSTGGDYTVAVHPIQLDDIDGRGTGALADHALLARVLGPDGHAATSEPVGSVVHHGVVIIWGAQAVNVGGFLLVEIEVHTSFDVIPQNLDKLISVGA